MPIMLEMGRTGQADEVIALLDSQKVPYTIAIVDSLSQPRLQVGNDEIDGVDAIREMLPRIVQLVNF
jgi:hypothetical protein